MRCSLSRVWDHPDRTKRASMNQAELASAIESVKYVKDAINEIVDTHGAKRRILSEETDDAIESAVIELDYALDALKKILKNETERGVISGEVQL